MWSGRLKELVTRSLKPSTSMAIIYQFPGSWVMNEKFDSSSSYPTDKSLVRPQNIGQIH